MDYLGHPYYVTGNAITNALAQSLPRDIRCSIHASHGMFAPGQFGVYPDEHSKLRAHPSMGAALPEVEAYDDLFLHRHPEQLWLLDSRPRDAINAHDLRRHSGHPTFAYEMRVGRESASWTDARKTTWFVHAYLHAAESGILPLDDDMIDGLQFGGKRNYGYGATSLHKTRLVDLEQLDYSRLEGADRYRIDLCTPFVLSSDYPGTTTVNIPEWWEMSQKLRHREECLVKSGSRHQLQTIDHGQQVTYTGDCPVETAKAGLTRIGTHSKYGFGEFRIRPITTMS
ncbi:hypothetical protein [Haloferax massiliensis]|nr:hypothetical protein [Haloferax massiliensis]